MAVVIQTLNNFTIPEQLPFHLVLLKNEDFDEISIEMMQLREDGRWVTVADPRGSGAVMLRVSLESLDGGSPSASRPSTVEEALNMVRAKTLEALDVLWEELVVVDPSPDDPEWMQVRDAIRQWTFSYDAAGKPTLS